MSWKERRDQRSHAYKVMRNAKTMDDFTLFNKLSLVYEYQKFDYRSYQCDIDDVLDETPKWKLLKLNFYLWLENQVATAESDGVDILGITKVELARRDGHELVTEEVAEEVFDRYANTENIKPSTTLTHNPIEEAPTLDEDQVEILAVRKAGLDRVEKYSNFVDKKINEPTIGCKVVDLVHNVNGRKIVVVNSDAEGVVPAESGIGHCNINSEFVGTFSSEVNCDRVAKALQSERVLSDVPAIVAEVVKENFSCQDAYLMFGDCKCYSLPEKNPRVLGPSQNSGFIEVLPVNQVRFVPSKLERMTKYHDSMWCHTRIKDLPHSVLVRCYNLSLRYRRSFTDVKKELIFIQPRKDAFLQL